MNNGKNTELKRDGIDVESSLALIGRSHECIHVVEFATGRFLNASERGYKDLGYTRDELLRLTVFDVAMGVDRARFEAGCATLKKEGHASLEALHRRKDGTTYPVDVSLSLITLDRPYILADVRNITERKRAEELLRENEARYRTLVENIPQKIFMKDRNFQFVSVNEKFARDLGNTPDECRGKTDYNFFPVELADKYRADDRRIMETGQTTELEEKHLVGGREIWVNTIKTPVRDCNGEIIGLFGIFWDITERKRAEELNNRLAMAVEQASETIVITDTHGTILYVNPAFEKTSGYTRAEALGQNARLFKSGRQDAQFYRDMWERLGAGEIWHGHFVNRRKDGTVYEEEATISPVRDAAGKTINYVAVKRDVTHEVRLEAQYRQAQKMEAIGRLAGGVAHDFNNILSAMLMQAELAEAVENLPESARDCLGEIRAYTERAANLTRQLLLFSRQEAMQPRDLDLNNMVANLTKMLRCIIGDNVQMELNLHSKPLMIHADPGMVDQVLLNLAVNARDAMPKGGRLLIKTTEEEVDESVARFNPDALPGRYVSLIVEDTGCGISPEALPRIFEPFFTTKDPGKGTGLGLATVFGIVKQHKGWLKVDSQPGRGASFQIFLPTITATAAGVSGVAAQPKPHGGTETILLVEDELALRTVTRALLTRHGYKVLEAANGVQALQVWHEHREIVALLLTDVMMPGGVTGLELARQLRAEQPRLKVLLTSGYTGDVPSQELPDAQRGTIHRKALYAE